jgi:hypothetical protein
VPWYVSITISPAVHFQDLLKVIFRDRWPGFHEKFVKLTNETLLKGKDPPQLQWKLSLPSDSNAPEVHESSSLQGLNMSLEWLRSPTTVDALFGSHDWGIYVSQPYSQRPKLDVLQIVHTTVDESSDQRITLITTSGDAMVDVKQKMQEAVQNKTPLPSTDVEQQIFGTIRAALSAFVSSTSRYAEESSKLVQKLVGRIRAPPLKPTRRKLTICCLIKGHGLKTQSFVFKSAVLAASPRVPRLGRTSLSK